MDHQELAPLRHSHCVERRCNGNKYSVQVGEFSDSEVGSIRKLQLPPGLATRLIGNQIAQIK